MGRVLLYWLLPYRRRRCAAAQAQLCEALQLAAVAREGLAAHRPGSPYYTAAEGFARDAAQAIARARRAMARYCPWGARRMRP